MYCSIWKSWKTAKAMSKCHAHSMPNMLSGIVWAATSQWLEQVVNIHPAGAVGREGLMNQIPVLTPEYLHPSQWNPVLAPNPLRSRCLFTLHQNVASENELSCMCRYTSEIGQAGLRSNTEIVPKSPFLCVNRSPIRYGFRAGQMLSGTGWT